MKGKGKTTKVQLYSPAKRIGELLAAELKNDPHFYFFSPDETTSNKLDRVYDAESRAWGNLVSKPWDLPEDANGRIVELLSENVLFSVMTGHLMNGEKAMLASYEAFLPIITAQLLQQIKFIKQSKLVSWRQPLPAVNLLSTSTCWRQDHNGFTHQSPALISTLLSIPSNLANCFFPIDDVAAAIVYQYMIKSTNVVNLTTFDKNDRPRYLKPEQAENIMENGAFTLEPNQTDNPDFVFTACGDIVAQETIKAIKILRRDVPEIKIRFVYINTLSYRGIGTTDHKLTKEEFGELFTMNKPIVANFHGYPETLENILENYTERRRLRVHGFNEEGSTTTPFEMLLRNAASRYDLALDIANLLDRKDLVSKYKSAQAKNHTWATQHGTDMV